MGNMIIQANMPLINAERNYKVNTGMKSKSAEKLSSGYRINRAADDAAGLSISEKMRRQIRGLERGSRNGEDGVSWVQTGDGALQEVHSLLHRMKELTVQALNDTNTSQDRAALQAEMDELQCEIDRITDTTQFNTKNIFDEHEPTFYQFKGNIQWAQGQMHVINDGANELTIEYQIDENSSVVTETITVPAGEYTTQELTDEIEDALINAGLQEEGIYVEFTDKGTFNVNLEGGEKINNVGGDLAYLLYDVYNGGGVGALIGTNEFMYESAKLNIRSQNDNISFDIEYFDGTKNNVNIILPEGDYTRTQIIDMLNQELQGTSVKATAYGKGIKISSNEAIVTGFKGDMFKIDQGFSSAFYDNVKYGNIQLDAAKFTGGAVITTEPKDVEHQKFVITAGNNQLTFTPNNEGVTKTITIPEGEYNISEMTTKLNELFTDNDLDLKASNHTSGSYKGLVIESTIEGATSAVGIDNTSSAYNTLFIKRTYNYYQSYANNHIANDNVDSTFTGSRSFVGSEIPLNLTSDNNEFKLCITENGVMDRYTITLDEGTYNSAEEIRAAIDDKLNGNNAAVAYRGMVDVSLDNNCIKFTIKSDETTAGVTAVGVEAVSGDNGYDGIFVGKIQRVTHKTVSGNPITLNGDFTEPITITDENDSFDIDVDGAKKTITLPHGDLSKQDVIDAIENQVQERTEVTPNTFNEAKDDGDTKNLINTVNSTPGDTSTDNKNYSAVGDSRIGQEGHMGDYEYNNPATVTMTKELADSYTVTDRNNAMELLVNGTTYSIRLTNGNYNQRELVTELNRKIKNATKDSDKDSVTVTLTGNKLTFTCGDKYKGNGEPIDCKETSISFSTATSSFITDLHKTETKGTATSREPLLSNITITEQTNEFKFAYTENGTEKNASVILDSGSYNRSGFINMLNSKLAEAGINITASTYSNNLRLTTQTAGSGNSVSYSLTTIGSSVEALFGAMTTHEPAHIVINQTMQESITIDSSSNIFSVNVNNEQKQVIIPDGTYTRQGLVDALNQQFETEGTGVIAGLSGNKLTLTTIREGADAHILMRYNEGGSSMIAIYGETRKTYAGIDASFNDDGNLVLSNTTGGNLSADSRTGGVFQVPVVTIENIPTSSQPGIYRNDKSYTDGVSLSGEPVTIDRWNNDLSFNYISNGTTTSVNMTLADGDYTYDSLKQTLQDNIDASIGSGKLTVSVDSNGVRIEAVNSGSAYRMDNYTGDFYYKVMGKVTENTVNTTASNRNGNVRSDVAFTVGRKDVKNKGVEIKNNINDTLTIDFTYGSQTTEFSLKMDPGIYKGDNLVNMLQTRLNEAMVAQGFSENMIKVGIGGISTGVHGSNDSNAINFKLSTDVLLPGDGEYIIDGVSGNV